MGDQNGRSKGYDLGYTHGSHSDSEVPDDDSAAELAALKQAHAVEIATLELEAANDALAAANEEALVQADLD